MKGFAVMFLLTAFHATVYAQKDIILRRDGKELQVKVIQVSNQNTTYTLADKHDKNTYHMPTSEIYMVKYEKRGNMFFTEKGERFFGSENGSLPSDATIIYLREGEEIVAYDMKMSTQKITYKKSKKNKDTKVFDIPKSSVFLIKYPDGTKDIISEFSSTPVDDSFLEYSPTDSKQREFPIEAIIKTRKDKTIYAIVTSETNDNISFLHKSSLNGPLYQIDKTMIEDIKYEKANKAIKKRLEKLNQ